LTKVSLLASQTGWWLGRFACQFAIGVLLTSSLRLADSAYAQESVDPPPAVSSTTQLPQDLLPLKLLKRPAPRFPQNIDFQSVDATAVTHITFKDCKPLPPNYVHAEAVPARHLDRFKAAIDNAVAGWVADCSAGRHEFVLEQSAGFRSHSPPRTRYEWKAGEQDGIKMLQNFEPESVQSPVAFDIDGELCPKPLKVAFFQRCAVNRVDPSLPSGRLRAWVREWALKPEYRMSLLAHDLMVRFPCSRTEFEKAHTKI
jgi:hypothetical protein